MLIYFYDRTLISDIYRDKTKIRAMVAGTDAKSLAGSRTEKNRTGNHNNYGAVAVNADKNYVVAVFAYMMTR